jgi:hypothetical protein
MAGGTQNRDAGLALSIHMNLSGKTKECGCPIHKRNGTKTLVDGTLFNRQGKDGLQSMCRIGKTLLDSFKHKMNGWKIIYIFDKLTNSDMLNKFECSLKDKKIQLSLFSSFNQIFDDNFKLIKGETNSELFFEFMSLIDSIIGDRRNSLLKQMNIYDLNLTKDEFEEIVIDFDPSNNFTKDEIKRVFDLQDIFCDEFNLHVYESSSKDDLKGLYHHSNFRNTIGKIREVYNEDGTPFLSSSGVHIRINKWNTLDVSKSDSRVERYFPDGDYKIANSKMRNINKTGLSADHIWPISLGGKHDISNLEGMPLLENIRKRNSLSVNLVKRVSLKPELYLSSRYIDIFRDVCKNEITQEVVFELERKLKLSIENWFTEVKNMDDITKQKFITDNLIKHNFSHKKVDKIINNFFS